MLKVSFKKKKLKLLYEAGSVNYLFNQINLNG